MNWKKFFKPSLSKLIILLVLSILPITPHYTYCAPCPPGYFCGVCLPSVLFVSLYVGTFFAFSSINSVYFKWSNIFGVLLNLMIYYFISCLLIDLFHRIKKSNF